MNIEVLLILLMTLGNSSAEGCGVTDFLEQLIQSVQTIQRNGSQCGPESNPRVGKAGPKGPPGQRGPPGQVDMVAVEQLFQRMINESLYRYFGFDGLCYMGMKSRHIPDTAVTASSFWSGGHEPYRGRLDDPKTIVSVGAWVSRTNAIGQWLQVDFGSVKRVAGVITQGRPIYKNQFVRSFKISCGPNENHLAIVQESGTDKVFTGNTDRDGKVYNRFAEVLSCRFIRIYPQTWGDWMSMRVEFVPEACYDHTPPFHTYFNE